MVLVWAVLLAGCESNETVVAEMERAIAASNVGIAAALVATEILGHTHDVPDTTLRHPTGTEYGCPGVLDFAGATDNFSVTLDYAIGGCAPDTGLVPTVVAGHAGLQWDGTRTTATFDQLFVDLDNAVTGTLGGPVELLSDSLVAGPTGTVTIGPSTVDLDLHVAFDDTSVSIDGDVTVLDDDSPITFDGVVVLRTDIALPCPTPSEGTATLTGDKKDVIVRLAEPSVGVVTAERGNRVSEAADLCSPAYASDLF
jgi:hypothetical protein